MPNRVKVCRGDRVRVVYDMYHGRTASRGRGIWRYVTTLMSSLQRHDPVGAYIPFDPGLLEEQDWNRRLSLFLTSCAVDTFVISSPFEFFRPLPRRSFLRNCKLVAIVYDLIPLRFPQDYLPHGQAADWYRRTLHDLRACDMLLTISEATRQDLRDLAGVDDGRVRVIGGAVDDHFTPGPPDLSLLNRLGIKRDYIVYVGALNDPRKNLPRLIRAFARAFPPSGRPQLVLVSGDTATGAPFVQAVSEPGMAPDDVVLTGHVPDEVLVHLYRGAAMVAYPSLWEGLGLPVLEGMACGTPVLTSNRSSMSEIAAGAGLLVNPESTESIAAGLASLLEDRAMRDLLRSQGLARVERFRWKGLAQRTLQALQDCLAQGK
jgi:glycosyltransferase involved in cell wall biosynthesis